MFTEIEYGTFPLERAYEMHGYEGASYLALTRQPEDPTFVDSTDRKYKKPPAHFSTHITNIDGDCVKKTCHPGSTFSGYVQLNVEFPLAAQYLKLLFKATEHIYENSNRKVRVRLFSVKTVLWGSPNTSTERWPVISPGKHQFFFLCELPLVNYPPTFRNHLASCEFEVVASLERPGIRPFQTVPIDIRYQPLIITTPLKIPPVYQKEITVSNTKVVMTLPKGTSYNLLDSQGGLIDIELFFSGGHSYISHLEASLKRQINVSCQDYQQADSMTLTHVEQSTMKLDNPKNYFIQIPIPTEKSPFNTPAIQRNFSVLGVTTSLLEHSKYTQITYTLLITARVRCGLLFQKRTLFSTDIQLGTLSPGLQVPSNVISCSSVPSNATILTKPRFLYVPGHQEQLPAYQDECPPPQYFF
ncbi:hypothetical protein BY458DRAFT_529776 [Sporodiniella umbellata]|nr:hypothetical protein BY458DRAFT_529776 [Sporodiniella umbellata]